MYFGICNVYATLGRCILSAFLVHYWTVLNILVNIRVLIIYSDNIYSDNTPPSSELRRTLVYQGGLPLRSPAPLRSSVLSWRGAAVASGTVVITGAPPTPAAYRHVS